jgi:hypothetical protein
MENHDKRTNQPPNQEPTTSRKIERILGPLTILHLLFDTLDTATAHAIWTWLCSLFDWMIV